MSITSGKVRRALAAFAALAVTAFVPLKAEAVPVGFWSIDGGAYSSLSFGGPQTLGGIFGITFANVSSNSPGSPLFAKLLQTEFDVTNLTGVAHTLSVIVGDTGYTSPVAPPDVQVFTSAGGSITFPTGPVTAIAKAWLNPGNTVTSTPSGTLVANIGPFSLPVGGTASTTLSATGSAYALIQQFDITAAGYSNYTSSMNTSVFVPEPGALLLMGAGLLGLGLLRRRK